MHHISENESHYKNFLLAVLELQPLSVEDFSSNDDIIKYLPQSSRNDYIYENCFEIVRAILNGSSDYDNILEQNDSIRRIFLGFEAQSKNYQLYIDNQLVCEFSRMLDGNYKTYEQNFKSEWIGENELPDCYVIFKKDSVSQKERIKDFIQLMPNLTSKN